MNIDVDYLMQQISDQTPVQGDELILRDEIVNQIKIFSLILLLGIIMFIVSVAI